MNENILFEETLPQETVEEMAEPVIETAEIATEAEEIAETTTESEEPAPQTVTYSQAEGYSAKTFSQTAKGNQPYHDRYYLKYGESKRTMAMDLAGTKDFLKLIGFDGGELKQARERKNDARALRDAHESNGNRQFCSYCGTEISGVEYYRLPDGRLRCNSCNSTIVKDKAEVEALCRRVIANLDSFFHATINAPVAITMTEHRKLKKKLQVNNDSPGMLILGVAINKNGKYSLMLENGAPAISVIATFAHELTHIWQYVHWTPKKGFKKLSPKNRLLMYEGMAKWVEIQYLYLIGETNIAQREEMITRQRNDEYGIGFRMYEDKYPLSREAMSCDVTPFTLDRYPLD